MSRESVNSASSTGSGSYMGAFSARGSGRGGGGGPFLSFRGFNTSREKKSPMPHDLDDAPVPPSPEQVSYQAVATTGQPEVADTALSFSRHKHSTGFCHVERRTSVVVCHGTLRAFVQFLIISSFAFTKKNGDSWKSRYIQVKTLSLLLQ